MTNLSDMYTLFGVSAPDTAPLDDTLRTFTKNSRAVAVRYSLQSYVREGFDFYHSDEALQLAKDYLQGCYSDYVFLQGAVSTNTTDYALYYGDIDFDGDTIDLKHCQGFLFRYENTIGDVYRSSKQGSLNFPSLAIVNGSGSSSSSPSHSESFSFQFPVAGNYVSNLSVIPSYISNEIIQLDDTVPRPFMYSSFDDTPHLIEGVQNYAVAAFVVCFAVLAFRLADRLFRRVY